MFLKHRGVIQPVFDQTIRFVIFNNNIGTGGQFVNDRLAFGCGNIDCDRLLVAIGSHEIGAKISCGAIGVAGKVWPPTARVVTACFGVLYLDDGRAKITQQLRGCWSCQDTT